MPDNNDTTPEDNTQPQPAYDPLGIIDWVIGGKYRIKGHLGGGGFGEVYEGFNENLPEQRVVIKFFKRVQAREKFAKEAKILCMLDHNNINRVIDFLPDEGAVVVSYIDGQDCSVILKKSGALPEHLFMKVARGITSAVAYAHAKKIAHRDIKPGNIIVDKNENVYLIDFGIAKEMGTDATKTAYTALTPMFAAPERQAGDKDYNPFISDIYEMGVTLFNMATNSLPYRNPTNPLFAEWGGVAARRLSPELTRILKKATHPDPSKRYTSAASMAEDMRKLDTAFGRKRKKTLLPYVALLVVVVAVAAYLQKDFLLNLFAQSPSTEETSYETNQVTTPGETDQTQPDESIDQAGSEISPGDAATDAENVANQSQESEPPMQTETQSDQPPESAQLAEDKQSTPPVQQEEVIPEPEPAKEEIASIEPKKTPPPPPKSEILLTVTPQDITSLTVDGTQRQPGQRFDLDPGRYVVVAVHPDYPVYRGNIDAPQGPVDINLDFAQLSGTIDTIGLQVALIPPTDNYILELTRNGRLKVIINFPYLGLQQLTGEWYFKSNLKGIGPAAGKAGQVDSCVIYPFTPDLRNAVYGAAGTLRVAAPQGQATKSGRLLIYWSEPTD
jgi:serine/threonine protein kinase